MKIAFIGSDCEDFQERIWTYKVYLEKTGHDVDIFDAKDPLSVAAVINASNYDFIHLLSDSFIGTFNRTLKKSFCVTSHNAHHNDEARWDRLYKKTYMATLKVPGIIAMTNQVSDKYVCDGYKGFIRTLSTGCAWERFKFKNKGNGKVICLGKTGPEDGKTQALLNQILLNENIDINFIGSRPGHTSKENYLGKWDDQYLEEHLTDYSCLVLVNKHECAPLIVPKALAAGLSVVVSQSASFNLEAKPYIYIVQNDCLDPNSNPGVLVAIISKLIADNQDMRQEIREYAHRCFDWNVIMKSYINMADEFNAIPARPRFFKARAFLKYSVIHRFRRLFILLKTTVCQFQKRLLGKIKYNLTVVRMRILKKRRRVPKQHCHSAALIFIGIGKYIEYFPEYYRSCQQLFLSKTDKTYYVITDNVEHRHLSNKSNVVSINVDKREWPFPTLFRFKYINQISEKLRQHSHIIFLDADMLIKERISQNEFFCHDKPLFGVQHPGFINSKGTFEERCESLACVSKDRDLSTYWQACFWGGQTEEVLKMSKELEQRIDDDLSRRVIAIWHDESHLNKYYVECKDKVHTHHSGYAYPAELLDELLCEKKIIHLIKDYGKMRGISQ